MRIAKMYVYLSKKIAIPSNSRLHCISWNQKQGYIAVGGEGGLLKVLGVDSHASNVNSTDKSRGLAVASNLSMNQTLEGHSGNVQVVTWNEEHKKLTSSDQSGVIIVWMLYKGSWYEEMINNRNKSVVKGMAWSKDGEKICIVYEDGAVVVGSVDGNRIWGRDLKNTFLSAVQWSPDGKFLLLGLKNGEVHLYDNKGTFFTKLNIIPLNAGQTQTIVAMHWYDGKNGYIAVDCPTLAICYRSGKVQLMRNTMDGHPIVFDTGMATVWCAWDTYGSLLAVIGIIVSNNVDSKKSNAVQFYTPFGQLVRTLKIPGREVTCCSWEEGSLRLSLSIDSYIYFANIKPNHKWTYFNNTLVFTSGRISKEGICITFWNTSSNTCCMKYVQSLVSITSKGEHCLLIVEGDPIQDSGKFMLMVCNTIATSVDTKFTNLEPLWVSMTNSAIVTASKSNFFVWNFRTPRNSTLNAGRTREDGVYHIDDTPMGVLDVIRDLEKNRNFETVTNIKSTMDPISCLCATDRILLIGRESGMIQRYSMPQIILTNRYNISSRPDKIAINCISSRASIIDVSGVLTMLDLELPEIHNQEEREDIYKFQRRDVWAMCWALDNPSLIAVMEKTRMYVIRGLNPEEPIICHGYICSFQNLEIRCVLLDDLIQKPENTRSELIVDLEVKSLRDTRELLSKVGLAEASNFIQDNPHPRLWRLLAESALKELNLEFTENAMVRCTDYLGLQFIKRLRNIHNNQLKKAEIAAFLGDYDKAEKQYLDSDRRDLAINLRQKLGDSFRVIQLMQMGIGGSDKQMEFAFNKIGDHFAERQDWGKARDYYEKGRNLEKLVECYYKLEDYHELAAAVDQLPDKSLLLKGVAKMLASIGMCSQAVTAYMKYEDVKQAVDTCVRLNHWDQAVNLTEVYKIFQVDELLNKYTDYLLSSGRKLQAIELYRKANHHLETAKILMNLAKEQARDRKCPLRVKMIYVLAALLIEDYVKSTPIGKGTRSNIIMGISESYEESQVIENAWKGAEAFHFLLLVHKHLFRGNFDAAMKTSLKLREYENFIKIEDIYSLLALSSCLNRAFGTCSRAFIKLESLKEITEVERKEYEDLALDIFRRHEPNDTRNTNTECVNCGIPIPDWCITCPNCMTKFATCVVSGESIMDLSDTWICTVCRHYAISSQEVVNIRACPLCHSTVTYM